MKRSVILIIMVLMSYMVYSQCGSNKVLRLQKKFGKLTAKAQKYKCPSVIPTITIDKYIEKVRIDTNVVDNGYVYMDMIFGCDSLNNVYVKRIDSLEEMNANIRLSLKDNKFVVRINVHDTIFVPVKDTEKVELQREVINTTTNYLTWWQKMFMWIGICCVLTLIIFILFFAIKRFR